MDEKPTDRTASHQAAPEAVERTTSSQEQEREMLKRYHEQQRRMRCVGCGESEQYF